MLTRLCISHTFVLALVLEKVPMLCTDIFLSVSSLSQVDLRVPTKVTGIITQGAKDFGHVQFVGSYKLAYSNNGERWKVYQDEKQGKDKVRSFHCPQ